MRFVITGGTGVLGRHLVRDLLRHGHSATVLSRLATGHAGRNVVRTDYSRQSLRSVFQSADAIVHLAASRSGATELDAHVPSLELSDAVFSAAAGVAPHIVFASSISVYGLDPVRPWSEDTVPMARKPYGILKLAAEHLGAGSVQGTGTKFTALRFAHLYGAGENNKYMVNVFMEKARVDQDLHLHTQSTSPRDFLYAGNAAAGIRLAVEKQYEGVINIGSGSPVTGAELAGHIVRGFNSSSRVVVDNPDIPDQIRPTVMDISRARRLLGYTPALDHRDAFKEIKSLTCEET